MEIIVIEGIRVAVLTFGYVESQSVENTFMVYYGDEVFHTPKEALLSLARFFKKKIFIDGKKEHCCKQTTDGYSHVYCPACGSKISKQLIGMEAYEAEELFDEGIRNRCTGNLDSVAGFEEDPGQYPTEWSYPWGNAIEMALFGLPRESVIFVPENSSKLLYRLLAEAGEAPRNEYENYNAWVELALRAVVWGKTYQSNKEGITP